MSSTRCSMNGVWAASGKIYYVCDCAAGADARCAAGNTAASDSHTATQAQDPATPWRTLNQARTQFNTMAAGDTIALCRGGAFAQENDGSWGNANCRADNPCTLRDYDPAWDTDHTAAQPLLTAAAPHERGMPFMSGGAGYRVLNVHTRGDGNVLWGYGLSSTLSDLTLCNVTIDTFGQGVQDDCGGHTPTTARLVIIGSKIVNNSGQGVLIGADHSVIADNYWDNNGYQGPVYYHSIYLSNHADARATARVTGNEIYRNAMVDGVCTASIISVHGQWEDLTIEGNVTYQVDTAGGGCWGIGVGPGAPPTYAYTESFRRTRLRRNRFYGVGSVGIAADQCPDCTIENNLIVVDRNGSGGVEAIKVPQRIYHTNDAPDSDRVIVRNNTVYFAPSVDEGHFVGLRSLAQGTGLVAANNVFAWYGSGSATFFCFSLDASFDAVSHNACYGGPVNYGGATGTVTDAPQFTSTSGAITSYDLTPAAGSPLVDAGDGAYGPTDDLDARARDDDYPDIGAYER